MSLLSLKKTNSKHIRLLFVLLISISQFSFAQCNITFTYYVSYAPNETILISDTNAGFKNYYIEYGLSGFTPGTDSIAGVGGTIRNLTTTNPSGVRTSLPLASNTLYDVYVRKKCGNNSFTPNGPKQTTFTNTTCGSLTSITSLQNYTPNFSSGYGAWNFPCIANGKEVFFKINSVNGGYGILRTNSSNTPTTFLFNYSGSNNCFPFTFWYCVRKSDSLVSYKDSIYLFPGDNYILSKCNSINGGLSDGFSVDLPCDPPTNFSVYNIKNYSFDFSGAGQGAILEVGPGSTPGRGPTAGPGNTVYNASGNITVNGLQSGTLYHVYLRKLCTTGGDIYSYNSPTTVRTIACPRTYTYPSLLSILNVPAELWHIDENNLRYYCTLDSLKYGESVVKFTPSASAYYNVTLSNSGSGQDLLFAFRQTNNTCDFTGYNYNFSHCSRPNNGTITIGPLTGGITYDLLTEPVTQNAITTIATMQISCTPPAGMSFSNIKTNEATISFTRNSLDSVYIEYGPYGYTPGTGTSVRGLPGTVLTNLLSNTTYTVYLKNNCGGSFSTSISKTFRTLFDCSALAPINCGVPFIYTQLSGDVGYWSNYGCGLGSVGSEKGCVFTPAQNGVYKVTCNSLGGVNSFASLFYKEASGTCDQNGWNCIGSFTLSPKTAYTGSLIAGTTYIIIADASSSQDYSSRSFTIDCAVACINPPSTPGTITGLTKPCPGDTAVSYSVPLNTNATSYQWSLPAGVTIKSGFGTNSIKVNFSASYTNGTIAVVAVNGCGTSPAKTKNIYKNTPGAAPAISGLFNQVCGGSTQTYSIAAINNATNYLWTVPSGTIINNGQGTNSINVTFLSGFISGSISVKGQSICGFGTARTLAVRSTPKVPVAITGPATACSNQQNVLYSIAPVSGANWYTWVVPAGASITSGQGTTSLIMKFGTVSGLVKVKAKNACGFGGNKTLNVVINCREEDLLERFSVLISPNPTKSFFNVEANFSSQENYTLVVRDVLGKIVAQYQDINSRETFSFGKELINGIYVVEIFNSQERKIVKVIKNT